MESQNSISFSENQINSYNTESLEKELKFQLNTLIGTTCSFLFFFIITFFLMSTPEAIYYLPIPLIFYNFAKIIYCLIYFCCSSDLDKPNLIKDIFESFLMIGYYVFFKNI